MMGGFSYFSFKKRKVSKRKPSILDWSVIPLLSLSFTAFSKVKTGRTAVAPPTCFIVKRKPPAVLVVFIKQ